MVVSKNKGKGVKEESEEENWTRYILDGGKLEKVMVSKKEAMKDIDELLEEDKDFLKIMEKL